MWDFNQVIFQGRITGDAKLEVSSGGRKYCRFSIANNTPRKNQDGTYGEYTSFVRLSLFDDYADRLWQKIKKGRRVLVLGKLFQDKWTDTNGGLHDDLKIKVVRLNFDPLPRTGVSGEVQTHDQDQLKMNGGMVPFTQSDAALAYDNRPITHTGIEPREEYGFEEALPF